MDVTQRPRQSRLNCQATKLSSSSCFPRGCPKKQNKTPQASVSACHWVSRLSNGLRQFPPQRFETCTTRTLVFDPVAANAWERRVFRVAEQRLGWPALHTSARRPRRRNSTTVSPSTGLAPSVKYLLFWKCCSAAAHWSERRLQTCAGCGVSHLARGT